MSLRFFCDITGHKFWLFSLTPKGKFGPGGVACYIIREATALIMRGCSQNDCGYIKWEAGLHPWEGWGQDWLAWAVLGWA